MNQETQAKETTTAAAPPHTPAPPLADNWDAAKEAFAAGNRAWIPCTEEFHDNMLNLLPPCKFFSTWHVVEEYNTTETGEGIYLFFNRRPVTACRLATHKEIRKELGQ